MQIRILTPKSTSFLRLHQALLAIESGVSIHMKLSYNMVYQKAYPYSFIYEEFAFGFVIKGSSLCVGDLFIRAITILSKLLFNL